MDAATDYTSPTPGTHGRLFAEPTPSPDPTSFQVNNTSSSYYQSAYYLAHKTQVQPIPAPTMSQPHVDLADVIGQDAVTQIQQAQQIVFHAVGDTGAAKVNHTQIVASALAQEDSVADAMAAVVQAGGPGTPSFFFHLGDVVYSFGEAQYYHDQFYEPYRDYDRPIFAIPGNHDGMVFGASSVTPQVPTLDAFLRNFCATTPAPSPDSGGLVRSVMTQPGVYFTLDAPFVSIIGLYSNVLDGPGVISSQGGHYPICDDQLAFLKAELIRLKPDHDAGHRAVLIAVHHPPASVDGKHGGSTGLSTDIDNACTAAGLWPDAVLSGHAHLYQRFSRTVAGLARAIPYVTSGSGGYAATAPKDKTVAGTTDGPFTLVTPPIIEFGYLTVTVDMSGAQKTLTIDFKSTKGTTDSVTVKLTPTAGSVGGAGSSLAAAPVVASTPAGVGCEAPTLKSGTVPQSGTAKRLPKSGKAASSKSANKRLS
jgi:hypothetical protein